MGHKRNYSVRPFRYEVMAHVPVYSGAMRSLILALMAAILATGCVPESSTKPVEFLDARSALTVGALRQPIELVPNNRSNGPLRLVGRQHASFAYLGPVEWDRSGQILYGLWVHVAPGAGIELGDIRAAQVLVLQLDDGAVSLTPMDAPQTAHAPYEPIAAWGQTTYFALDAATLKRMAASNKLTLDVRAEGGETVNFFPTSDTKSVLASFIDARGGLTPD